MKIPIRPLIVVGDWKRRRECCPLFTRLLQCRPAMSDSAGRYTLLRQRLDAFTRKLGRIHEGDIEAVHSTRVASRRLRELLPLLELDASTTRKLVRRVRNVTRELGAVRQLDVLMLMIDRLDRDCRCSSTALKELGAA